jgi:hypothetical protein
MHGLAWFQFLHTIKDARVIEMQQLHPSVVPAHAQAVTESPTRSKPMDIDRGAHASPYFSGAAAVRMTCCVQKAAFGVQG